MNFKQIKKNEIKCSSFVKLAKTEKFVNGTINVIYIYMKSL